MTILLLQDLIDHRARKGQEIAFYSEQKAALEKKLATLRREINLTDEILRLIRKEQLTDLGKRRDESL